MTKRQKGLFIRSLFSALSFTAAVLLVLLGLEGCNSSNTSDPPSSPSLASFVSAQGGEIAADASGNVYLLGWKQLSSGGVTQALYKFAPNGASTEVPVQMNFPHALAADKYGNVYLGDSSFCGVTFCTDPVAYVRRIAPDGTITALPIVKSSDGTSLAISSVLGLGVDSSGDVYIASGIADVIYRLTPDGNLTTFAGAPCNNCQEVDGSGRNARFNGPFGLALDSSDNLYVTDRGAQTVRRVTPDGIVTTIAGTQFVSGSSDGQGASATFNKPWRIAVDSRGNVYVADSGNALIRKIDPSGLVSTLAGTRGASGFTPGPLPGVIDPPFGLALYRNDLYFGMDKAIGVVRSLP